MNIDRNVHRLRVASDYDELVPPVDEAGKPRKPDYLYTIKSDSEYYHSVLPSARIVEDQSTSGLLPINDIVGDHIDTIVEKADEVQTSFALYCTIDAQVQQRKLVMAKLGVTEWIIPRGEPGGEDLDERLAQVKETWEEKKAELATLITRKDHVSVAEERFTVKMGPRIRKPAKAEIVSDEEDSNDSDYEEDDNDNEEHAASKKKDEKMVIDQADAASVEDDNGDDDNEDDSDEDDNDGDKDDENDNDGDNNDEDGNEGGSNAQGGKREGDGENEEDMDIEEDVHDRDAGHSEHGKDDAKRTKESENDAADKLGHSLATSGCPPSTVRRYL